MSEPSAHARTAREEGAARAGHERDALARLTELVGVVYRLRDPDGCPWDREQTVESMLRNLVEETFEVSDAVAAGDDAHIAEELGDVLMNVVLMARIAEQDERFDLARVAAGIAEKLVRRHPHVFGDQNAEDEEAALASWNAAKSAERAEGGEEPRPSALDGVPRDLPALLAALRVGEKAAGAGFDWPDAAGALEKLDEEVRELSDALARESTDRVEEELGDVLFSVVNVARKTGLDPELALRRAVEKFRRRFAHLEDELGDGLAAAELDEMERLWREAAEREPPADDVRGIAPRD